MEVQARRALVKRWNHPLNEEEISKFFDWQLTRWDEARERYEALASQVQTRVLPLEDGELRVQYNPSRIVSTGAKVDKKSLKARPCFLCENNRPNTQRALPVMGSIEVLVNPFPILPHHRQFLPADIRHKISTALLLCSTNWSGNCPTMLYSTTVRAVGLLHPTMRICRQVQRV